MKTTKIQLIVFLFIAQIVVGQNCNSNFVKENYKREAQRAARQEMLASPNSYNKTIEIPEVLVNKYLKCFNSIYYSNYSCVDTIFSADQPIIDNSQGIRLFIKVPKTEKWLDELEIGKFVCGNSTLQSLLCSYNFRLSQLDSIGIVDSMMLCLESDSIYNEDALSKIILEEFNYPAWVSNTLRWNYIDSIPENFGTMDTISYMFVGLDYLEDQIIFVREYADSLTNYSLGRVSFYFTVDTTCNAKLLRTHYADYSQVDESCPVAPFIQNNYYQDAQQLAMYQIWDNPQPYSNQVIIPDTLVNKYLKALQSVYASGYSCVDSIFDGTYPIHELSHRSISILMEVPQSESWLSALEVNKPLVGHDKLETILSPYNYYVQSIYNTDNSTVAIALKSDRILNDCAIFQKITEQTNYTLDTLYNDIAFINGYTYPDDWSKIDTVAYTAIRVNSVENSITLNRSFFDNLSNYPLGYSSYEFTFDTTCNAKLLRTHYADYSTNSTQIKESLVEVYPNPVTTTLHLKNVELGTIFYMYKLSGNLLKEGSAESPIDVSGLNQGMYILRLIDNHGGIQQYKIMKQ